MDSKIPFWEQPSFPRSQEINPDDWCRKCKKRRRWDRGGEWCQRCVEEACCSKYPMVKKVGKAYIVIEKCKHRERDKK